MANSLPAPIEGLVVDTAGQPVPGATVGVLNPSFDDWRSLVSPKDVQSYYYLSRTVTGPEGTFRVEARVSGTCILQVSGPGFGLLDQEITAPAQDVCLVLGRGASLKCEVVDEQDQPVPRARIALWVPRHEGTNFPLLLDADEAGSATVRGLAQRE